MPDFEKMSDAELRAFKSAKHKEAIAAREEARAADAVLMRKRAEDDAKWQRAAFAARDMNATGEEHDRLTRLFFEMATDEMDAAIEKAKSERTTLTREERRAAAAAVQSSHVVVNPPDAAPAGVAPRRGA